jgi:hypothetical protein
MGWRLCSELMHSITGQQHIPGNHSIANRGPDRRSFAIILSRGAKKWKQTWMWENLKWTGEDGWIASSIQDGSCIVVTDGSYMKHLFLTIHSAALVLESQKGRGRLWCSFPEASTTACSYRGELVCLMAIHLLLLAVNETYPAIQGSIHLYSDCLGVLDKARNLPPARIPANWAHFDVLKNILVNCRGLTFDRYTLR